MNQHRQPSQIANRPRARQVHRDPPEEKLLTAAVGAFILVIGILAWVFFLDGLGQ